MKIKQVLAGFLFTALLITGCKSSKDAATANKDKEVLFTIDDKPYYTDEFVRVYNKNLELVKDDSQKDLDNYLDLFIGYKLKVNKANKLGLQENKRYQGELKSYRNQLSKNYLTDTKVTEELINEAYQRSLKEIDASHILFLVDENAAPADTLKAYNKAIEVRNKAVAGEDFGKLAQEYSEDPSAKDNQGNLGYFSVFRMVYPFETGAYTTPKGEVSKPIRSRFGYHVIKVNDIRDNRGDISVAHIMIMKPRKEDPAEEAKAKTTINEIYQKLKQGEDFATLAKQFSQDKTSAVNGGQLSKFSSGELTSTEFEDHAFALNTPGEYSEPFETQFGWHIIKLTEKYPRKPFEDVKADFETRIGRDDRSKLIATSMTEKLREKYHVKTDDKVYKDAAATLNDSIYIQSWKLSANADAFQNQTLLVINKDKEVTAKAYLDYVNAQQRTGLKVKPVSKQADVLLDKFKDEQLNAYYDDNLETEFPEFGIIMEEYRDGLLLFDLMEKEIWDKAKKDTIAVQQYYMQNMDNYRWNDRAEADVFSSTDKRVMVKVQEYLKQGKEAEFIKEELNTANQVNVMEKSGVFEKGSDVLPQGYSWKTGVSDIISSDKYYYVVKTDSIMPTAPKTLEEAKGKVINDYQQHLESTWAESLKKEFTVKVNNDTFEKVKKELNQ